MDIEDADVLSNYVSDDGLSPCASIASSSSVVPISAFLPSSDKLEVGIVSTQTLLDLDRTLLDCQLRSNRSHIVEANRKQPWEVGHMGLIFGGSVSSSFYGQQWLHSSVRLPPVIKTVPEVQSLPKVLTSWKRPVISSAVLKIRRLDTAEFSGDAMRFRAMSRWRALVALDLNSSSLGRQLIDFYLDGKSESVIQQILEDTLSRKATGTLTKRSSSLLKYVQFTRAKFTATSLCYREQWIYDYVCMLRNNRAAPSAAKSFLEAMTLARTLIGADIEDEGWKSSRVTGAASSMYLKKAPLRQADPLTVLQVKILHHVVENAAVPFDIVLAGYFLFCVYACCRWSDPQRAIRVVYDVLQGVGYFELGTNEHKTASTEQRKTLILPLVATSPGLGAREPCWVDAWISAREELDLHFQVQPTMPARTVAGGWSNEPMSASEGSASLKGMLEAYGPKLDPKFKTTSHALKATGLSWAAKRPLKKAYRRALGHHVDASDLSVSTYSRDFMYAPLLAFDLMQPMGALCQTTLEPLGSGKLRCRS